MPAEDGDSRSSVEVDIFSENTEQKWRFPYFLEVAVLLYSLAFWPLYVITILYVYSRLADASPLANNTQVSQDQGSTCLDVANNGSTNWTAAAAEIQLHIKAAASEWQVYMMMALYIPGLVAIPVIGVCSDRVGRKPLMLVPVVGGMIRGLGYVIVDAFNLDIVYLLIPTAIEGCTGYLMGYASVFYAYLADITTLEERTHRFVVLNSIYCVAGALCVMFSGNLVTLVGYYTIFWIVTAIYGATLLFILFLVPHRAPNETEDTGGICQMLLGTLTVFKIYTTRRPENPYQRVRLNLLLVSALLTSLVVDGNVALETLYLIGVPYCMTSVWVGYFNGIVGIVGAVGAVLVVRGLQQCLDDIPVIIVAAVATSSAVIMEAFTTDTMVIAIAFPILYMLSIASSTLLRAALSKNVHSEEQGALQSSFSIVGAIGQVLSSSILINIYLATMTSFNGFVFLFCGLLELCVAVLLGAVHLLKKKPHLCEQPLLQSTAKNYSSAQTE